MQIIWKGHACFNLIFSFNDPKAEKKQISILIDPYDNKIGARLISVPSDILLITHDHYDHNNAKVAGENAFVINMPGEYEIKGIFIEGIKSFHDNKNGKERGVNTIYTIEGDGIKVCHMGDFGQDELSEEQLDSIGDVDILLIPVGGIYTVDPKTAWHIVSQLEPKIVIPMHYQTSWLQLPKKLHSVEEFLKIAGQKDAKPQNKLVIKQKDLPREETKVIVLEKS